MGAEKSWRFPRAIIVIVVVVIVLFPFTPVRCAGCAYICVCMDALRSALPNCSKIEIREVIEQQCDSTKDINRKHLNYLPSSRRAAATAIATTTVRSPGKRMPLVGTRLSRSAHVRVVAHFPALEALDVSQGPQAFTGG